jgi:hypothetical protein
MLSRAVAPHRDFPGFDKATHIASTGPVRSAWFKDSEGNLLGVVALPE